MLLAAVVLLALLGGGVSHVVAGDRRVQTLSSGSIMEIESYAGVPKWRLLPHLFSEKTINVTCPGITDFSVYVAEHPEKLVERVHQKRSAWCGLQSLVTWDSQMCITRVSPFAETAVAVVHPPKYGRRACTFQEQEQFSWWQLGRGALGVFLFLEADALVNSIYFRLSTGTGGFVLLSFIILAFIIYRSVPNRKAMTASMALFGSTLMSAARYFVGSWFPSLEELMYNKWVALYVVASALIGLSVTYYYDDPTNTKLNTILERGLQLGGLALVATSTSLPEASFTAAGLLLASRLCRSYLPSVPGARFIRRQAEKLVAPAAVPAPQTMRPRNGAKSWPQSAPLRRQRRLAELYEQQQQQQQQDEEPEASEGYSVGRGEEYSDDIGGTYSGSEAEYSEYSDEESGRDTQRTGRPRVRRNGTETQSGASEAVSGEQTPTPRRRPSSQRLAGTTPQTPLSPLIQSGLVYNEATGRTLQIGKPTYNKLLRQGYQVDQQRGMLTPPPGADLGTSNGGQQRSSGGRKRKSLNVAAAMALPE